jgi:hypothetical protein
MVSARSNSGRAVSWSPCACKSEGKVVEARRSVRMFGSEDLLADRQCTLKHRPRACEVSLELQEQAEIVEARPGISMMGTKRLLSDC